MSVNKVMIVGRLGNDPELKTLSSGSHVCNFSIATSERWTDKEGQKQEKTEWHRIVTWGRQAELCGKYLSKGRQIFIEGRLQTRTWEDQQGQKRYTTEIVCSNVQFLGSAQNANQNANSTQAGPPQNFGPEPSFEAADDIPF